MDQHGAFMQRAIDLSRRALDEPGLRPFGAVVVKDGHVVGEGVNMADGRHDPTSHGEVEAIRAACAKLATTDLSGCDLYTSCEPCAMCTAAMHLARIARVFYAASAEDSAAAFAGAGKTSSVMPPADLREQVGQPVHARRMPAEPVLRAPAVAII